MIPFTEGKTFYACGVPIYIAEDEKGETHAYSTENGEKLSDTDLKFGVVFGGSKDGTVKSTSIEMRSGFLKDIYGGSFGGGVEGNISLTLSDGMIGGFAYGGGNKDVVCGDINVKVTGGAVKYGLYGGGISTECGNINMYFDGIVCTNVKTSSRFPDAVIKGDVKLDVYDGHMLEIVVHGNILGDAYIKMHGGKLEKQILNKISPEKLHVSLYENIFEVSPTGGYFPMIPEEVNVEYLPAIEKEKWVAPTGDDTAFFDRAGEEGKLTFRFFELRHPEMPYELTPFPAFIGDAFLIDFPNGSNMLVDAGMDYSWNEINKGLTRLGVEKIDVLMITHAHTDHMGCCENILDNYKVSEIWLPDTREEPILPHEERYFVMLKAILDKAVEKGVVIKHLGEGDVIDIGEGDKKTEILVLNPARGADASGDLNNTSIACKVTYKNNSAMLCGDITDGQEADLAKRYGEKLKTDLLKASHHGIVYQNFYTFIDECAAKYIVVPSLRDRGVFLKTTEYSLKHVNKFNLDNNYVTGRWGKIKVTMDGSKNGVKIATEYK